MEEEKLEVEMLVEKKSWRHGYSGKHNVYGGHASGSGRGRVLCGGEGGRAGRGAVDVDQKLEDVDMKVVVAKEVRWGKIKELEAGKDQQLYPLVAVEEVVVEKLMAEVEFIAE
ncbi:hypothetical protein Bca52824_005889 [Brassica carinata]|uniref:Uncharacterized protein n=1 Tax=Brassica carinata TaxID=52824 RepID=A0A8X7WPF9_BRACI|nr:hypothetical protein Bca52824_005889 [Brassica carinata]